MEDKYGLLILSHAKEDELYSTKELAELIGQDPETDLVDVLNKRRALLPPMPGRRYYGWQWLLLTCDLGEKRKRRLEEKAKAFEPEQKRIKTVAKASAAECRRRLKIAKAKKAAGYILAALIGFAARSLI